MTFDFDLNLSSLTLLGPTQQEDIGPKFTLFPTLPTELRLKIIRHTLPTPGALKLTANILVADPTFGLYLIFSILASKNSHLKYGTALNLFGARPLDAPKGRSIEERRLNVLAVNHEFRNTYLEAFPFTLPTGHSGPWLTKGLIRYSAQDSILLLNFGALLNKPVILRAISENWRLQTFWGEIPNLTIGTEVYMTQYMDACVEGLEKMRGLKHVKVYWARDSSGDVNESVRLQMLKAFKGRLEIVEGMLRETIRKRDIDGGEPREVPKFELLDTEGENW